MTDLAQLKELGAKATQGEWEPDIGGELVYAPEGNLLCEVVLPDSAANAAWIAATCPAKLLPMLERMEVKHSKIQEAFDTQCEDLQHICEQRDCPAGEKRTEWLDTYITTLEAENKALREALEQVIAASDECTGAEPSLSALLRTIDIDARAALTPATGA